MSDNYPAGDMLGSGVYDVERTMVAYCNECDESSSAEVTRRGRTYMWDCPLCGEYNETEEP